MKILLTGAEICPPWTEGRKRFVRDLCTALSARHEVHLLTTAPNTNSVDGGISHTVIEARTRLQYLTGLHRRLPSLLKTFRPDLVCQFPYGTFRHIYGLMNLWHMRAIDRLCMSVSIPCLTLLYSVSREAGVRRIRPWVRYLVLNNFTGTAGDRIVRLGVDFRTWATPPALRPAAQPPRLLFMAGMWQQSRKRLKHVLSVRGLEILLRGGARLAASGMRLTVAAPLLADHSLQAQLRALETNTWPLGALDLRGESLIPDIYAEHDLFVFPYMREETQFIPTSVVEAMRSGIPVVIPDLDFLRPLAAEGRSFVFRADDAESLVETITGAFADAARYAETRRRAYGYVTEEMSIERSCEDIESLYTSLTK